MLPSRDNIFCSESTPTEEFAENCVSIGTRCHVCCESLPNFEQCLKHQKIHIREKVCVVCGNRNDSLLDINLHFTEHFSDTLPALAKIKHQETNESVQKCVKCAKALDNSKNAVEHCKSHRPTDISSYTCVLCLQIICATFLDAHMLEHFQVPKQSLLCKTCCKTYRDVKSLKYHRCLELQKYQCSVCPLGFRTEHRLKFHEAFHFTKKTFCDICQKDFKFESKIYLHVSGAHEGIKDHQFSCGICERTFRSLKALHAHERLHKNNRPFACERCHSRFLSNASLNAHLLSHEANPRYHCLRCDYTARRKYNLLNHVSRFHNEVADSQDVIQCRNCYEVFPNEADMKLENHQHSDPAHEKSQSKSIIVSKVFKCDRCDRCFVSAENLRSHKLVHDKDGELKYICRFCGVGFYKHDLLVRHRRVHSNVTSQYTGKLTVLTVFPCERCGIECTDLSQLLDHKGRSNCLERIINGTVQFNRRKMASRLRPLKASQLNINADGIYECLQCHRTYKNRRRYRLHIETHSITE